MPRTINTEQTIKEIYNAGEGTEFHRGVAVLEDGSKLELFRYNGVPEEVMAPVIPKLVGRDFWYVKKQLQFLSHELPIINVVG